MEELVDEFIKEGKQEYDDVRTFIRKFKTSNELLMKEQNNLLSELKIEIYELSRTIRNVLASKNDVKGITTRGGRTTFVKGPNEANNEVVSEKTPLNEQNDMVETQEPKTVTSPPKKDKEDAQLKKLMENLKQLHINIPFIEALIQMPNCTTQQDSIKEKDPGSFTIPCRVGDLHIENAQANLGASISLMPYAMYEKLRLGEPKLTRISLELGDRSIQYPIIHEDLFPVKGLECMVNDVYSQHPDSVNSIRRIEDLNTAYQINQRDEFKREQLYTAGANKINKKKPELKNLPSHLEYAYLDNNESRPVIISSQLFVLKKKSLLQVLEKRKGAIAWKMFDIKGLSHSFCTHKILIEDNFKPTIQPQRQLNPRVQDVVKDEIVKLLDSGLIYLISNSSWVSPIHVVPKKGGVTVVLNDENELIPLRTVIGWRVCIDYRKLNDATRKDHFPLPFIDQMLERLSGNDYYSFLDGF
ncbi:hypothetical protein Tco_1267388 [Tanacetum coccineum]